MIQLDKLALEAKKGHSVEFSTGYEDYVLRVEAQAPGVFRFCCGSLKSLSLSESNDRVKTRKELSIIPNEQPAELTVVEQEGAWLLAQRDYALLISTKPFSLKLLKRDMDFVETQLEDDEESSPKQDAIEAFAEAEVVLQTSTNYDEPFVFDESWALMLDLPENQSVYGLGMSEHNFDRRSEEFVSDQAVFRFSPLAWTTQGWGLYLDGFDRCIHSVATIDDQSAYQIRTDNKSFDLYLFTGTPLEIFDQYTALSGRGGQPTLQAMGVGLKQLDSQGDEEFLLFAKQLREHEISLNTLEYAWPGLLQIDNDRLNIDWRIERLGDNTRAYFDHLQENNWHAIVPTFPAVIAGTHLFEELGDRGWLIMDAEGDALVFNGSRHTGGQDYGLLDLTYKDAYNFWRDRHQQLLEHGQSLKTVTSIFELPDEACGRHNEEGALLRKLLPTLIEQSLYEGISSSTTPPEGVVVHDQINIASQRRPYLEIAPFENSWQGLNQLYRTLISAQNSSVPFLKHMIGRAGDEPMSPELYLRWLALSTFSANFSFHAEVEQLPIYYDEDTQNLAKQWLGLRYRLIPYVLGIIEEGVRGGQPVQNSMPLAFPSDPVAAQFDRQFLFGPAVLVAPILDEGGSTLVYLPANEAWWDLNTGERYEGGQTLEYSCGLDTIPAFGREGHMLAVGPTIAHLGEMNSARLLDEIWLFGMPTHNPVVMRNKIRVMQMQGSSYIKGLEGLKILPTDELEVKRRGAEVRISPLR
ncbi:MAG: glycoside hydrolase family 31 protein [Alcaligenaceae bacterium]|nr:glycoside hydrolase family 31 protein [Alcaligenaceae bacterium]